MRIVAVRHLPTQFNAAGLLQGRRDEPILPLTQAVERAIEENRKSLAAQPPFEKVLVSSLCRTAMTADHYGYQSQRETDPLLDELDFGCYEGRPRTEMLKAVGSRWVEAPQTLTLGEPLESLGARVSQLLNKYKERESLLIFGHGAWIRAMVAIIENGSLERMNQFKIANNELYSLQW